MVVKGSGCGVAANAILKLLGLESTDATAERLVAAAGDGVPGDEQRALLVLSYRGGRGEEGRARRRG